MLTEYDKEIIIGLLILIIRAVEKSRYRKRIERETKQQDDINHIDENTKK